MKTPSILKYLILISEAAFIIGIVSCEKNNSELPKEQVEVEFTINMSKPEVISGLKTTTEYYYLDNVDKVLLTIQNSDGSPTQYTMYELKIFKIDEYLCTQKIVLETGNYLLTGFLVLDDSDSTIFAAPLVGSLEAQNVDNPLPLLFSVGKNATSIINIEVISTIGREPEDFGLSRLNIFEVKTFAFMMGVTDGDDDQFISCELTVKNESYSYFQSLDNVANNIVTLKDNLKSYTVTLKKTGYSTFSYSFSLDSLMCYSNVSGNIPLVLELQKSVTDIDGNEYCTVKIGNQVWMAENLRVTRYNDGTDIPLVTDNNLEWSSNSPRYCWYNNNEADYKDTYGALYNWYVLDSAYNGGKNVCPEGWHVPTEFEWTILMNYLGGKTDAGGKLKETGTEFWNSPNVGANNEFNFSAIAGGERTSSGRFGQIGVFGFWWSASEICAPEIMACYWYMHFNTSELSTGGARKGHGFSIRCVKD